MRHSKNPKSLTVYGTVPSTKRNPIPRVLETIPSESPSHPPILTPKTVTIVDKPMVIYPQNIADAFKQVENDHGIKEIPHDQVKEGESHVVPIPSQ